MMASRRRVLLCVLLVGVVLALAYFLAFAFGLLPAQTKPINIKPKGSTHAAVCSLPSSPCIKVTEQNGTVYRLNDFRFAPGRCLAFISLPDGVRRVTCGNYKLDWIGPGPDA